MEIDQKFKGTKADLCKFGITMGVALCLLGVILLWRGKDYYSYPFLISAIFFWLAGFSPNILRPVYRIWMKLTMLISCFVTMMILIFIFYLVVAPIGLLARLFGKNFLDIKLNKKINSYWIERDVGPLKRSDYKNQF